MLFLQTEVLIYGQTYVIIRLSKGDGLMNTYKAYKLRIHLTDLQNVLNENNFAKIDNSSFATFSKNTAHKGITFSPRRYHKKLLW